MNLSTYLATKQADRIAGDDTYDLPLNYYVGLFLDTLQADGTGTEATAAGYARQVINRASGLNRLLFNKLGNKLALTYEPTATLGPINSVGIFDAEAAGNLLWYKSLDTPITVLAGQLLIINPDQLTWEVS